MKTSINAKTIAGSTTQLITITETGKTVVSDYLRHVMELAQSDAKVSQHIDMAVAQLTHQELINTIHENGFAVPPKATLKELQEIYNNHSEWKLDRTYRNVKSALNNIKKYASKIDLIVAPEELTKGELMKALSSLKKNDGNTEVTKEALQPKKKETVKLAPKAGNDDAKVDVQEGTQSVRDEVLNHASELLSLSAKELDKMIYDTLAILESVKLKGMKKETKAVLLSHLEKAAELV